MLTIAVVNTKGGVGKTLLACTLAVRAAADKKRVGMVDLDPQKSLIKWWTQRGGAGNPEALTGVDTPADAIERLELTTRPDIVFLDGPPAFLTLVKEMVEVADFAIIPIKASTLDILATQDAVVLAQQAGTPFVCVINDIGQHDAKFVEFAKRTLLNMHIPIAESEIKHRVSHIAGMNSGKTASEVNKGKDKEAAAEIDRLWEEIRPLAAKAAKARAKHRQVTHV